MSKRFEYVVARCLTTKIRPDNGRAPAAAPRNERVWRWVLRLVLPLLAGLVGLVVYWLWFDSAAGGHRWLQIIGGVPLAFEIALVALWAAGSWYFKDMT
jgi:hypothetical protein